MTRVNCRTDKSWGMKSGGRFLLHKENPNLPDMGSGIKRELVWEQRLYRYQTGTAGGSSLGRRLKQMNIIYLLIFKLDEPDVILMLSHFIKPLESRLSPAVLGKVKIFSSALFMSLSFPICLSPSISQHHWFHSLASRFHNTAFTRG